MSHRVPWELAESTIAIIDDHQANIDVLRLVLSGVGLRSVWGETDPQLALARLAASPPDLVLLDWHMPGVAGEEVLRSLRQSRGPDDHLPVVVLTADVTREAREAALAGGATDFLTKPLDPTEVVLRVRNLLATGAAHRRLEARTAFLETEMRSRAEDDRHTAEERLERTARVTDLLRARQLSMVFQPIVDLADGTVVGAEALARFPWPPLRPPDVWFAEADTVGLGVALELLAVELAVSQLRRLPAETHLSVNASAATVCAPGLARVLDRVAGHRVVIELTEHARVDDYAEVVAALDRLRGRGVRVAVDDAGAGYAGLQHILQLRPEIIKLDRDLIRGIDRDPARQALAASQVVYARDTGTMLVAEGVETPAECTVLRRLGIDWGQGYLFGRPAALPLPQVLLPIPH